MLYHSGVRIQRGRGIGSLLGGLFRTILPKVASSGAKVAKRIIQSDIAKDVGRQLRDTATNSAVQMTADALEGKNVSESLQNQLDNAKKDLAKTIRSRSKVRNTKRKLTSHSKTSSKSRSTKKRKQRKTIFDE